MYAIIETGGKQYRVSEGETVAVEKLDAQKGESVTFDRVLLVADGEKVSVGQPYVEGAKAVGKVLAQDKARKILVFRYKAKKNVRKRFGHRQPFTRVLIEQISAE
ncbi:MAG TPA: 50S ribosomal protein L21 [Firmicutes bacterium]|nr:50S ribosomal protein L21 [Bacillota bacterium]